MPRRPSKPSRPARSKPATRKPAVAAPPQHVQRPAHDRSQAPSHPAAIQAPWRLEYLEQVSAAEARSTLAPTDNFLRDYWLDPASDERNHVIVRSRTGLILLNRFPYAAGHLLVALAEARPTLLDYTPAERADLWRHVDAAAALLRSAIEPQGINIGINQGRAAGAGVPHHLHVHLVPRWAGDVNFMSVVGNIRVIPASLETMAAKFRAAWLRIRSDWQI